MSNDKPGRGLGMGLSALLGDAPRQQSGDAADRGGVREIDVAFLQLAADDAALREIAGSPLPGPRP